MRKKESLDRTLSYSSGVGDLLKRCKDLNQTNISNQDQHGRTVLHYASEYRQPYIALMIIEVILNAFFTMQTPSTDSEANSSRKGSVGCNFPKMSARKIQLLRHTYPEALQKLLDCQDINGDTALHLSARAGNASVVSKLITAGANFKLKNVLADSSLLLIYKHAPTALKAVYDSSIESVFNDCTDENTTYNIDFSSLVEIDKESAKLHPESKLLYKYISNIGNRPTKELFNHPLIQLFIDLKWRKIRVFLWISVTFHMIWLLIYSSLISHVYKDKCPFSNGSIFSDNLVLNKFLNSSSTLLSHRITCKLEYNVYYEKLLVLMTVFSVIILISKVLELRASKSCKFCCLNFENISQILMIFVMFITLIPVLLVSLIEKYSFDHIGLLFVAAALGIFLAWLLMFWQFKKFPTMALYIEIWVNVTKGFATLIATFASLLLAFAFAFQILLPSEPRHNNFFFNFMRLFVMMAGEIGFDTYFFAENIDEKILPFPGTTKVLYFGFVIMVSIILFNVLIAMTVSDTQELRKSGKLRRFASQLESIYLMEHFLFNSMFQCCAKRLLDRLQITSELDKGLKRNVFLKDIPWHLHDDLKKVTTSQNTMNEMSREILNEGKSFLNLDSVGKQNDMHSTFQIFNDSDPLLKQKNYKEVSFDSSEDSFTEHNDELNQEVTCL